MAGEAAKGPAAGEEAGLWAVDRDHLWHPYAPLPAKQPALPVVGAQGVYLQLADGRQLIDGMSSWWCAIHGYRNPFLQEALRRQLAELAHVMFGGLTHRPAVGLASRLLSLLPPSLDRIFLCDSGSVAVEVALKLALQYQQARGERQRGRILTIRGGYHGDTLGAMSICDPVSGMHHLFSHLLPKQLFAPRPPGPFNAPLDPGWARETEALFARAGEQVAAVVVEPLVQGAGGMHFYSPSYLHLLRALADRAGALLVFDEIATGFGRTGTLFAFERAAVLPDILCLGKALTGGYLTLAATVCREEVARVVSGGEGEAFMHGPTFMANPLACAAACASLDLLREGGWEGRVKALERGLKEGLAPAAALAGVREVRVLGAIGVVEAEAELDLQAATEAAVGEGVWLRPFRNLIYTMPPYITTPAELSQICQAVVAAAAAVAP